MRRQTLQTDPKNISLPVVVCSKSGNTLFCLSASSILVHFGSFVFHQQRGTITCFDHVTPRLVVEFHQRVGPQNQSQPRHQLLLTTKTRHTPRSWEGSTESLRAGRVSQPKGQMHHVRVVRVSQFPNHKSRVQTGAKRVLLSHRVHRSQGKLPTNTSPLHTLNKILALSPATYLRARQTNAFSCESALLLSGACELITASTALRRVCKRRRYVCEK